MGETSGHPIATRVREGATTVMFVGFVVTILGALMIAAPLMTGIAVAILVGILLMAAGILRLVFAMKAKSWGAGAVGIIVGILAILCGIIMVANPEWTLGFLTLLLAGYLVIHGVFEIITAVALSRVKGWGWMLFGGLLAVVLGAMIWRQWPVSGAWAIGVLVGVNTLFNGWSLIALGSAGRTLADRAAASAD